VALTARRTDKIEAAARDLVTSGYRACAAYLDVTNAEFISTAFDALEKVLGDPIDILFNNSGVLYSERFLDQDMAEVSRIFDTNLKGPFQVV
jgi:NADP-dependent 3-hydroxy acid dehydrogenase YdfG